ncbi:MAG: sugar ABC transporter ATP-binding protein [Lachnoclostridium edouardi]|uniref:sugar ABC transporter ATP-binding protein n=1 Tax=Lachnoclostridium edouardi TaxID=1926283 RepID=UPI0026DA93C8|nr:sugar ABC transporter ATP-binding protein [Lachnoclostridium edouardi]MDO4279854.1 sugar ABC transporter ATP-binding protein [Lachnoclostridium edouardi]
MEKSVLRMKNIEKCFGGVYALKGIDFDLEEGEVHALLGENGAGKSTLIKVLGGIHKPDGGMIEIQGKEVAIDSVKKAREMGIGIIHQEIVLVPHLTAAENIFLGREIKTKAGLTDRSAMFSKAEEMVKKLGIDLNVRQPVEKLTIAQQQLVEITKAISFDARILVMDEPTSSLTDREVEQLFSAIERVTAEGRSVIYISHRLEELFRIAKRVTVIRDGAYIGTELIKNTNPNALISMMVGRTWEDFYVRHFKECTETVFQAMELTKKGVFENVSFTVKKGEVVGFAGLVGAGRSEIMLGVYGAEKLDHGSMILKGEPVLFKNTRQASEKGIALVPESRKEQGLILDNTVAFNLTLSGIRQFVKGALIDKKGFGTVVNKYIDGLNIKTPTAQQIIRNLSGGNQQKVVLAKALATQPDLLILDEPTRGVDVGAKKEIYTMIDQLAMEGMAIVLVSSELPEIVNMCDRVYVVADGKIQAEIGRENLTQENIMRYATGGVA